MIWQTIKVVSLSGLGTIVMLEDILLVINSRPILGLVKPKTVKEKHVNMLRECAPILVDQY